ncbi:MAG: ribose-phosphate pyrophosphokinase [Chloroflexi bacterium]|nr:MAG: ribose-phosphate pyrophosphokinase [Chloroflexota bacterium]
MTERFDPNDVRIFSGQSHPELAQGIANHLGIPLSKTNFSRFSNDNMFIQLCDSVRGRTVYLVQSLTPPVSDHLLELFMMLDIASSAAAKEVHAIIPYFSYARSDKKNAPRISITARLIADLLHKSGATQVMTMTLHSPQVHGFFSIPTDPLTARGLIASHFQKYQFDPRDTIVIAPDYGRAASASRLAKQLGLPSASAEKTRISDTEVRIGELVVRQLAGFRRVLIYDDEIATGSSVLELCKRLKEGGIQEIFIICTHGLFIGNALEQISKISEVHEIVTTDTVPIPLEKRQQNLTILSVAPVFGEAILLNYTRQSIGNLFAYWEDQFS